MDAEFEIRSGDGFAKFERAGMAGLSRALRVGSECKLSCVGDRIETGERELFEPLQITFAAVSGLDDSFRYHFFDCLWLAITGHPRSFIVGSGHQARRLRIERRAVD
jgi:hypothetical protein